MQGGRGRVVSDQARMRRFAIKLERDGMGLFALPCNLRWADEDGEVLSEPVEMRRSSSNSAALHARWRWGRSRAPVLPREPAPTP